MRWSHESCFHKYWIANLLILFLWNLMAFSIKINGYIGILLYISLILIINPFFGDQNKLHFFFFFNLSKQDLWNHLMSRSFSFESCLIHVQKHFVWIVCLGIYLNSFFEKKLVKWTHYVPVPFEGSVGSSSGEKASLDLLARSFLSFLK